jgi:hypothetical protein
LPKKGNASSTPACYNCQLADGEKAHPANYRGWKHAKEEMRKKKPQGTPKPTAGRVFSSNSVKPNLSFAAALRGQAEIQQQQEHRKSPPAHEEQKPMNRKQFSQFRLKL